MREMKVRKWSLAENSSVSPTFAEGTGKREIPVAAENRLKIEIRFYEL